MEGHYARLFEHAPLAAAARRGLVFPPEGDARETLGKISEMGFRHPLEASATVRRWLCRRTARPEGGGGARPISSISFRP